MAREFCLTFFRGVVCHIAVDLAEGEVGPWVRRVHCEDGGAGRARQVAGVQPLPAALVRTTLGTVAELGAKSKKPDHSK